MSYFAKVSSSDKNVWRKLMSFSENFLFVFNVKFILMVAKRPNQLPEPLNWRRIYHCHFHSLLLSFFLCLCEGLTERFKDGEKMEAKTVLKICQSEKIVAERFMRVITIRKKLFKKTERYWNEEFIISLIARCNLFCDLHSRYFSSTISSDKCMNKSRKLFKKITLLHVC